MSRLGKFVLIVEIFLLFTGIMLFSDNSISAGCVMFGWFFFILVITVIVVRKRNKEIQILKNAYDEALRGTDKQQALIAGRIYYQKLRHDGRLTIYDESAINNDLATMK